MLRSRLKVVISPFFTRKLSLSHASNMNTIEEKCNSHIQGIFQSAIDAVGPRKLIERAVNIKYQGSTLTLTVDNKCYDIDRNVYVVGFGKAVSGMARAVDDQLHEHIVRGIISIPKGSHQLFTAAGKHDLLLKPDSKIKVFEGAKDNLPDEDAYSAALEIQKLVKKLTKTNLLLVLISGGGSALQPLPCPPITLQEELELTKVMSKSGANINELNVVRKNIEVLKGGGLVQAAQPAKVISLIMSDVIGDPLDIICSGPTVPDPSCPEECLQIFKHLDIEQQVPNSILEFLQQARKERSMKRKALISDMSSTRYQEEYWNNAQNVIVGNIELALAACKEKAENLGYKTMLLTSRLDGEAKDKGKMFAKLAKYIALSFGYTQSDKVSNELVQLELDLCRSNISKESLKDIISLTSVAYATGQAVCLLAGGETVVNVKGSGRGGRNLEMAVSCALELWELFVKDNVHNYHIAFLSGGTDGQDGPTDVAGGVVTQKFITECNQTQINAKAFLKNNDTYNLLKMIKNGQGLVRTGLTGTNVMDVQILIVEPKMLGVIGSTSNL